MFRIFEAKRRPAVLCGRRNEAPSSQREGERTPSLKARSFPVLNRASLWLMTRNHDWEHHRMFASTAHAFVQNV